MGVAEKVCVFLMLVASAYMQSISAFVAQNNGAGLPERSRQALFYGIRTVFVMVQGVAGAFCVRIPVVYLMSHIPGVGLFQIGLGTPISSAVQILLCIAAYRWYQNRAKRSAQ